ncbi:CPBP family intramembrane glutamic endopeptidase [Nocardia shimofusensis]|uniref:CPBP family intramembrane glutamic endopeptidase n=1 Tax=Nocardia shimofusensis TaxID=228596 RepID=UPI00082AAAA2|nr:CPBP family intramembrane glutamic endopeptidase [Nocardia shimofusensis]
MSRRFSRGHAIRSLPAVAALIAPPLWNNRIAPALGLGRRGRTLAHLGFAAGYAAILGGRPNWRSTEGVRVGLTVSSVLATGAAAALAVAPVRSALIETPARVPEVSPAEWIAVHIPFGTVLVEELVFRATLDPLLADRFGPRPALFLGAAAFGLWHVHPARSAGDPVIPTVVATTAAGALFTLLNRYAHSTAAPALLHLTLDATGAVIATLVRLGG